MNRAAAARLARYCRRGCGRGDRFEEIALLLLESSTLTTAFAESVWAVDPDGCPSADAEIAREIK